MTDLYLPIHRYAPGLDPKPKNTSQEELYEKIGEPVVINTLRGFNGW